MAGSDAEEQRPVVAWVNQQPIFADEVERELRAAYGDEIDAGKVPAATRGRAAEQVVKRRLVLEYLGESKQGASDQDVDFAIEQLKKELTAQNLTLKDYYQRGGWREEDFRRHLAWTIGWRRFMEITLTEANLQKFFERHLPDFDGREVRVAHMLLKVGEGDAKQREETLAEGRRIRGEIDGGHLTFDEAVKKYSQAPSAATSGGDLGFIRRREPMPESFSKAALWLGKGEVSQPVVTTFGVHLIQCIEIRPGKLTWRDSEAELRKAVTLYLFDWAAEKQRTKTMVKWARPNAAGVASGGP